MSWRDDKIGLKDVLSERWEFEGSLERRMIGPKGTLFERWGLEGKLKKGW
jgi:hypothetical protein